MMRQEEIFSPITIEVGDDDAERWRELRGVGKWVGFEVRAAVEEHDVIERRRTNAHRGASSVAEHVVDSRVRITRIASVARTGTRNGDTQTFERFQRHLAASDRIGLGKEQSEARAAEVARDELVRPLRRRTPRNVSSPARRHEIEPSIAVKVPDGETVPATRYVRESPFSGYVAKTPTLVMKHAHRAPLGCDGEIRPPVAVEIGEDGRRDESDSGQHPVIDAVRCPAAVRQPPVEP